MIMVHWKWIILAIIWIVYIIWTWGDWTDDNPSAGIWGCMILVVPLFLTIVWLLIFYVFL